MSAITDELLQKYEAQEAVNELLIIDPNTRQIKIPRSEFVLGVVSDAYSEVKYFAAPRIISPNVDVADAIIYVAWKSEEDSTIMGLTICTDYSLNDTSCVFGWTIPEPMCLVAGQVSFNVHFHTRKAEWHTTLAIGTVLDGNIMVDEVLEEDYKMSIGKYDLDRMTTNVNNILAVTDDLDPKDIDDIFGTNYNEYMALVDYRRYEVNEEDYDLG